MTSWNVGEGDMPQLMVDDLHDEVSESSSDDDDGYYNTDEQDRYQEADEGILVEPAAQLQISELLAGHDVLELELAPDVGQMLEVDFNVERLSSESEDEELQAARLNISSPGRPVLPSPSLGISVGRGRGGGGSGRGRGRGRGHGRGRGRGRGFSLSQRRRPVWSRGEELVEVFPRDEDLPASDQAEYARLESVRDDREGRERVIRANRDLEVGEDEESFHDCEGFAWAPMDGWQGTKEEYEPRRPPGPTRHFANGYDALRAYWDDDIVSHIVTETNKYAEGIQSASFRRNWVPTNSDEIWCLFAFWLMLGIVKMPSIKACFSKMKILRTEVFRSIFTEDRYWAVNRAFHLSDGSRASNDPTNPLYPMGPVLDHLQARFQELYEPEQDICIDESLTLWKGPLSFMQYIKTKSARFGLKTYNLCESATGYMYSFFVYVGKRTTSSPLPCSVSTVLRLVKSRLGLGHVLYMDNWFNSPLLARYLKRRRTDCVGTLRANRKNVPAVIQRTSLNEGEFVARQSGDVVTVALMDRKRLHLLSTYHNTAQTQTVAKPGRSAQYKLQLVADYNLGMGGVDVMDQMLEPYLVERKQCKKWNKKLFKRFLNVSVQNARILVEKSTKTKVDSLVFRLACVQAILDNHTRNAPAPRQRHSQTCEPQSLEARLTERHFPGKIVERLSTEQKVSIKHASNLGRGQCVWCKACLRRRVTTFECPNCAVPLCAVPCFGLYHTFAEPRREHLG